MPRLATRCLARLLLPALLVPGAAPCTAADAVAPPSAAASAPATWPFEPPPDRFSPDALLDLRSLNETTAGETGFVRVDADGDFVRGDGRPIRFWAVNSDTARTPFVRKPLGPQTAPDLARHARFLAKRGVNMVRQHRQLSPSLKAPPGPGCAQPAPQGGQGPSGRPCVSVDQPDPALTDIDLAERDAIWRMVAAMKKEGIYTTLSPYWAVPMKFSAAWGVAGDAKQSALGLLFFDPDLQRAYKAWLRRLLTETNPYTGIPLAQDPALAILELQNEDSLLFWTVDGIAGPQREALERRFGDFLVRKHGSLAQALLAWGSLPDAADRPLDGRMALRKLWELTQPNKAARLADQTAFYATTMRDFNREMVAYLHRDLGARQLVNAGNWKTADAVRLGDAERWSYTPGEVDAVNHYFGGLHQGANAGWAIGVGDRYTSDSALRDPRLLPINIKQTVGRPMLVTESAWVMPNAYASEGPFLVAAYSALDGIDAYYWFTTADEGWTPPGSANGYMPSQAKWLFANPDMLGSFPAAALAYRRGDIRRGTPVVVEHRALADLWQRRAPLIAETPGFDPNRDAADLAPTSAVKGGVSPDAFLVGPVQVAFDADPATSRALSLADWVTPTRLRANTGQIVLDRAQGWCRVDTPLAQGVAAHFNGAAGAEATHQLTDVRFVSDNAFGAAWAVSLDGLPLAQSKQVLVQYATQSRPTGWRDVPVPPAADGKSQPAREITSYGGPPWQVVAARLQVALRNPGLRRARALDMNGMPAADLPLRREGGGVQFDFPAAAMYVVLQAGL